MVSDLSSLQVDAQLLDRILAPAKDFLSKEKEYWRPEDDEVLSAIGDIYNKIKDDYAPSVTRRVKKVLDLLKEQKNKIVDKTQKEEFKPTNIDRDVAINTYITIRGRVLDYGKFINESNVLINNMLEHQRVLKGQFERIKTVFQEMEPYMGNKSINLTEESQSLLESLIDSFDKLEEAIEKQKSLIEANGEKLLDYNTSRGLKGK